jgi:hypothetical protein
MESRQTNESDKRAAREADATNDETLGDIEDAFGSEENTPEDEADVPSPDGAFDDDDELKQADPL